MKKNIVLFSIAFLILSCQNKSKVIPKVEEYVFFGDSISNVDAISKKDLYSKYIAMNEGDTLNLKFKSTIKSVCQKKGCWMNVALDNEEEAFVKFKDYAFFIPLNATEAEVIVNGKAFISIESIDELKHYAKDAGKTQAAIDSITQSKKSFAFLADGVLIKKQ